MSPFPTPSEARAFAKRLLSRAGSAYVALGAPPPPDARRPRGVPVAQVREDGPVPVGLHDRLPGHGRSVARRRARRIGAATERAPWFPDGGRGGGSESGGARP